MKRTMAYLLAGLTLCGLSGVIRAQSAPTKVRVIEVAPEAGTPAAPQKRVATLDLNGAAPIVVAPSKSAAPTQSKARRVRIVTPDGQKASVTIECPEGSCDAACSESCETGDGSCSLQIECEDVPGDLGAAIGMLAPKIAQELEGARIHMPELKATLGKALGEGLASIGDLGIDVQDLDVQVEGLDSLGDAIAKGIDIGDLAEAAIALDDIGSLELPAEAVEVEIADATAECERCPHCGQVIQPGSKLYGKAVPPAPKAKARAFVFNGNGEKAEPPKVFGLAPGSFKIHSTDEGGNFRIELDSKDGVEGQVYRVEGAEPHVFFAGPKAPKAPKALKKPKTPKAPEAPKARRLRVGGVTPAPAAPGLPFGGIRARSVEPGKASDDVSRRLAQLAEQLEALRAELDGLRRKM